MKKLVLCSVLILGTLAAVGLAQPPREQAAAPKFELGKVLPPHTLAQLKLTKDQEQLLAKLEQEAKAKLEQILTDAQKQALEKVGPPTGVTKNDGEPPATASIQWFTTWEAAKAEAARTGRPILLVSAAPHCAGVSGIW